MKKYLTTVFVLFLNLYTSSGQSLKYGTVRTEGIDSILISSYIQDELDSVDNTIIQVLYVSVKNNKQDAILIPGNKFYHAGCNIEGTIPSFVPSTKLEFSTGKPCVTFYWLHIGETKTYRILFIDKTLKQKLIPNTFAYYAFYLSYIDLESLSAYYINGTSSRNSNSISLSRDVFQYDSHLKWILLSNYLD